MSDEVRGLAAPPARYLEAAELVAARLLSEYPQVLERYGERGRRFGVHDTAYQIGWIMNAVELQSADLLRRDMLWLRDVLLSRQFPIEVLRRNFEITIEVCQEIGLISRDQLESVASPVLRELGP